MKWLSIHISRLMNRLDYCRKVFLKYHKNQLNTFDNIKLFLSDVDGVLTDAGMYYTENGDELKKFSLL